MARVASKKRRSAAPRPPAPPLGKYNPRGFGAARPPSQEPLPPFRDEIAAAVRAHAEAEAQRQEERRALNRERARAARGKSKAGK
jgi:hypothetical protein